MNKKWNEKTTLEKVSDIISCIALCVWFIFERLEKTNKVQYASTATCIAMSIVCVCQAVSFWNVKRIFSYVAIAGAVCLATVMILEAMLTA